MKRRQFLKAGAIVSGSLLISANKNSPQPRIKLAIVGTGWWGTQMILRAAIASDLYEVVALCDINAEALNNAADIVVRMKSHRPQLFNSYTEMYELEGLQAVAIATPTHWHALQFIAACQKGLHVFLEKPICYDIREGQAMVNAHKNAGNVVQVDFPRMMVDTNQQVKSFIESGQAGKILQVQAVINHREGPLTEKSVSSHIDFDTFCGPAPRQKFLCEGEDKPMWRGQHQFSRGILSDWGIHYIHSIRKILNLGLPDSIMAIGGITRNFTHDNPDHMDVRFEFQNLPVYWSHKTWGYTSPLPDNNYGTRRSTVQFGRIK